MSILANPALAALISKLAEEFLFVQVLVRQKAHGFDLRHLADRAGVEDSLRLVKGVDLRVMARSTQAGEFRALKCAPSLVTGWRATAADAVELGLALELLYPGAVADWFAALAGSPPVTHYREFTARQSGMYRITAMLDDVQAARVIVGCCAARACLKRRLWSVEGLAPDEASQKSVVPCLEPCAVMLDLARKAARQEQGKKRID